MHSMKLPQLTLAVVFIATSWLLPLSDHAAVFTNSLTIAETDTAYVGQDIVISNTVVTINGPHSFNSLLLTNAAVLTHSACTTTNTHRLDLVVTGAIVVSTNSLIDVSGKGYLAGRTSPNNTTVGATRNVSGGS